MVETKIELQKTDWNKILQTETWIAPLINLYETKDDYHLIAHIPGVSRENARIKIENDDLILMGKINYGDSLKQDYLLKEIDTANFYRKFKLSGSVDVNKIEAVYNNGILEVKLPKHERIKPRNIQIK